MSAQAQPRLMDPTPYLPIPAEYSPVIGHPLAEPEAKKLASEKQIKSGNLVIGINPKLTVELALDFIENRGTFKINSVDDTPLDGVISTTFLYKLFTKNSFLLIEGVGKIGFRFDSLAEKDK